MFDSNQFFSGAKGFYPLTIDQSLRFNDDDSAYLSRTPASAGNRKTWTWSGWVKRGNLGSGSYMSLFGALNATNQNSYIVFNTTSQTLEVGQGATVFRRTSAVYRDVSSWYHIVVASDTTAVTPADRLKIYVNGEEITSFSSSTDLSLNSDWYINDTYAHALGAIYPSGSVGFYLDGYLAEVHFTDGTAYTADDFGELKSGVWVAKTPSVTYGTNGFYLDFANSADIGNDVSGEGNDWTPNNFTASDVVLDSPTDNFCTWNPLNKGSAITLADGNLSFTQSSTWNGVTGTLGVSSGQWYFEYTYGGGTGGVVGVATPEYDPSTEPGVADTVWRYRADDGTKRNGGASSSAYGATWGNGDVIGVAFDLDAGEIEFFKNNVSQGVAFTNLAGKTVMPVAGTFNSTSASNCNFGQQDFTYTPPSGYLALCTANLTVAEGVDPALDASPSDYFNTVLWTGTGNVGTRAISGVGFQPDFVWYKGRSYGGSHQLHDAVRGAGAKLFSNLNYAESSSNVYGTLTSFDTDGFTGTQGSSDFQEFNNSGSTFVAWNWKANGSGVTNTDGSITSTVSANTTSGFSIVTWTGTGSNRPSIGHGLGVAPSMIIEKGRDAGTGPYNWVVQHKSLSSWNNSLFLNNTSAENGGSGGGTAPTSTVYYAAANNYTGENGVKYVAYCFAEVEGFSKFGSYVGNGSADGPFVYTGFRPAFVMVKETSGIANWFTYDSARDTYNESLNFLRPNLSNEESTGTAGVSGFDLLSNGFKLRASSSALNQSGATYIYMAFAENPFKYANAR